MKKPITPQPKAASDDDQPIVPPPASAQVYLEQKPVLYTADGKPLVRKIGF